MRRPPSNFVYLNPTDARGRRTISGLVDLGRQIDEARPKIEAADRRVREEVARKRQKRERADG